MVLFPRAVERFPPAFPLFLLFHFFLFFSFFRNQSTTTPFPPHQNTQVIAYDASSIRIKVTNLTNKRTFQVESLANKYPITNLRKSRALSHPFSEDYYEADFLFFNESFWFGDEDLLEAMNSNSNDGCDNGTFYPPDRPPFSPSPFFSASPLSLALNRHRRPIMDR